MIKITDLKPGMQIKLRSDLVPNKIYGGMYYRKSMKLGDIVTIERIEKTENGNDFFTIKHCLYCYTPEMVECVVMNYIRLTK